MKIKDNEAENIGIFQSKKAFRMVSISISALSLVALIFASLQLFTGIDFTILLLITAVFWFTVAFSNMFIISKFNS